MTTTRTKMVWFARFPHPEAIKGVWIEVGDVDDAKEDCFYLMDWLKSHLASTDEPLNVRFEKHQEGWANKFPEL